MTIYFRNTPLREPFTFESVGNHWDQEEIDRADGYPLYHYLQTERGIGEIKIQRKTYVLCEGQGVLIAPGIKHSYRRKSKEWLTRFATFTGVMENGINILTGNRNIIFTEKNTGLAIAKQLDMVLKKFETPPVDAVELSVDCYRLLMNFMDNPCVGNMAEEETYKKYVKPTIEKIETEFDVDLTVNELANSVYITPQYLSRLFIRFLGCSTHEYLLGHRINEAKRYLLATPKMEIQEIARQVGFGSASHFIAMFKKTTGVTPVWRLRHLPFCSMICSLLTSG